jgi:hypothetical protein
LTCMGTPHSYTQIKPPPLRPPHLDLSSLPRLPCSLPHSHSPTGTRMHTRAQAHSRTDTHRNTQTDTSTNTQALTQAHTDTQTQRHTDAKTQTRTQTGPPARVRSECRGMRVPDCECAISHYLQPCVRVCA